MHFDISQSDVNNHFLRQTTPSAADFFISNNNACYAVTVDANGRKSFLIIVTHRSFYKA